MYSGYSKRRQPSAPRFLNDTRLISDNFATRIVRKYFQRQNGNVGEIVG